MSRTDDNSVVYAISSKAGLKGTLVDAYGTFASSLSDEMIRLNTGSLTSWLAA